MTDYVRGWRLANLARIAQKVETKLRERQLPPQIKPLPTGIGLVLVDVASREEDDDLQYIYVNQKPGQPLDELTGEFIRYVLSHEGQEAVVQARFFPLPAKVVAETLSGTS